MEISCLTPCSGDRIPRAVRGMKLRELLMVIEMEFDEEEKMKKEGRRTYLSTITYHAFLEVEEVDKYARIGWYNSMKNLLLDYLEHQDCIH